MTKSGREESDQYKFDPNRDPIEASDEPEAEASEYGIYGYADHPGEAFEGEETDPTDEGVVQPPLPPGIGRSEGGKDQIESDHGSGFDQPMEEPQRRASRSPLPGEPDTEDAGE